MNRRKHDITLGRYTSSHGVRFAGKIAGLYCYQQGVRFPKCLARRGARITKGLSSPASGLRNPPLPTCFLSPHGPPGLLLLLLHPFPHPPSLPRPLHLLPPPPTPPKEPHPRAQWRSAGVRAARGPRPSRPATHPAPTPATRSHFRCREDLGRRIASSRRHMQSPARQNNTSIVHDFLLGWGELGGMEGRREGGRGSVIEVNGQALAWAGQLRPTAMADQLASSCSAITKSESR